MIRAALALSEVTGETPYVERALAWQATLDRTTPILPTAATSSPPTMPKAAVRPSSTTDEATPNPNGVAAQNLIRLAALSAQHAWLEQADKLFDGCCRTQPTICC